jgi:hypothetical protein
MMSGVNARRTSAGLSSTALAIEGDAATTDRTLMKKRVAAAVLWLYAAWFVASFSAFAFGLPPAIGPIVGLAAGVLVGLDPRRLIWDRAGSARPGEAVPA